MHSVTQAPYFHADTDSVGLYGAQVTTVCNEFPTEAAVLYFRPHLSEEVPVNRKINGYELKSSRREGR